MSDAPRVSDADRPEDAIDDDAVEVRRGLDKMQRAFDAVVDRARSQGVELRDARSELEALAARCEAAEAEALEQARLNGMGSEREAKLLARMAELERERNSDGLRIIWKHRAEAAEERAARLQAELAAEKAQHSSDLGVWQADRTFVGELQAKLATAEAQRDRLREEVQKIIVDLEHGKTHVALFGECGCAPCQLRAALAAAPLPDAYGHPNATGTNVVPPRGAAAPLERDGGVTPPRRDGENEAASGGASALAGAPDVARDDRNAEADLHATRASGSPAAPAQAATPSLPGSPATSEPTGDSE